MPYQITYTENPYTVTTRFFGELTDDELKQCCDERTATAAQVKKLALVVDDFADITKFSVSMKGVYQAVETALKASTHNNQIQYLSIMPTDLLYGLSRVWHAHTDETGWERTIVRSREEAEVWLKKHQQKS